MSAKVIELVRVSTEGQAAEGRAGIPAQREINRRTARLYGLDIVRTIAIIDVSGAAVLSSPEMQELLHLMQDPEIHGVVAKEFSRLMRPENFGDYILLQHFIETETILYLPDGPINLASKSGRLLGTIRAAMAGLERREIIERMRDGKEAMRRAGQHASGSTTLPFGVMYSKERGWAFTTEAEKVKQAFAFFLSGQTSYTEIGRRLNLPRTNVRFILENPIYSGWRVYDEKRDPSAMGYQARPDGRQGQRRKIKRPPDEVIRVRVLDGLVSEEDFARVQQMIELKRLNHWRARTAISHRYTYNGFLKCGEADCGCSVYTHSAKQDFYVCKSFHPRERRKRAGMGLMPCTNRHMLRKKLEPKIDYLLGRKLVEQEFLGRLIDEYNETIEGRRHTPSVDERSVRARLNTLAEKRERVLGAFFDGIIGKEERDRRVGEVEHEISTYQKLLMECAYPQPGKPVLDTDTVQEVIQPFAEWEFLEREDRRKLLGLLCPEIGVYRYEIKTLALNLVDRNGGRDKDSRRRTARSPSRAPPCR
jgi:DNA invertase Pin-like site-specific DNA recombinase